MAVATLQHAGCLVLCISWLVVLSGCEGKAHPLLIGRGSTQLRRLKDTCDTTTYPALKPSKVDSKVVALEWVGDADQYVFAITLKNHLWRSKDGGSTFEDITDRLNSTIKGAEPIAILRILPHKTDPSKIVFTSLGTWMWLSKDWGETFTPFKNPGAFRGLHTTMKRHPSQTDWMLIMARRPDCKVLDDLEMHCPNDLFVSQNFYSDMTWTNMTQTAAGQVAGFVDFDWGQQVCHRAGLCQSMNIPDTAIFATMYKHAGDWDLAWDPDIHFVRSNDLFKTISKTIQCGNQFETIGRELYLAVSNRCPVDIDGKTRPDVDKWAPGITLYTSIDGAASFSQTCLPVALKQEGYELLESHDGNGTIIIVDYLVKTGWANVQTSSAYTSGPQHRLFSMSLSNIYRQDIISASSDFLRVDGVPGVFIANQMVARHPGEDAFAQLLDRPLIETRITFNGGGRWAPIPAPTHFQHTKCDRCSGKANCRLHLHGSSSWFFGAIQFPSVYGHKSAPGLLMASGNTGTPGVGLDDNDGLCTWLSSDGGATWTDVAEGTYIYEYADWGGIIVMAKHQLSGVAEEVMFSTDMGRCWRKVPLESAMTVENIRIEPDGQRPKVILHGRACRKEHSPKCTYDRDDPRSQTEGILFPLDIANLLGADKFPLCKAPADFDQWTVPADDHQPRCLLGAVRQFTRRRQDRECLQGGEYARPVPQNKTCECTTADVECDFGYVAGPDGSCTQLPADKLPVCPTLDKKLYAVSSSGRRLVHSDMCTGVDKIIQDTDGQGHPRSGYKPPPPPPAHGGRSGHRTAAGGFFIFLLVAGILGGAFAAWWRLLAGDVAKGHITDMAVGAKAFCVSLGGLLGDSLARCWPASLLLQGRGDGAAARYEPLDAELNFFQPIADAEDAAAFEPSGGSRGGRPGGGVNGAAVGSNGAAPGLFTLGER